MNKLNLLIFLSLLTVSLSFIENEGDNEVESSKKGLPEILENKNPEEDESKNILHKQISIPSIPYISDPKYILNDQENKIKFLEDQLVAKDSQINVLMNELTNILFKKLETDKRIKELEKDQASTSSSNNYNQEMKEDSEEEINKLKQELDDKNMQLEFAQDLILEQQQDIKILKEMYNKGFKSETLETIEKLIPKEILPEEIKQEIEKLNCAVLECSYQGPLAAKKLDNIYSKSKKSHNIIFIPCNSQMDAKIAAASYEPSFDAITPIDNPLNEFSKNDDFPFYVPGREGKKVIILNNEYRFYYGKNQKGVFARSKPGCDLPSYYFNDYLKNQRGKNRIEQESPFFNGKNTTPVKRVLFKWNNNSQQVDVFVACKTKKDAKQAVLDHSAGYFNEPIEDPIHDPSSRFQFPHFHLGRKVGNKIHKHLPVIHKGIEYNYHYQFGQNSFGQNVREKDGCDDPIPFYSNWSPKYDEIFSLRYQSQFKGLY